VGDARIQWDVDVDVVIGGDLTAAAAYLTPAGGAVVTGVAPCGMRNRPGGTVGYTTSLGFGKKLERILREPKVAVAYHSREHGFAASRLFVLVQGLARVDLAPSRSRLEEFRPSAERFLGPAREGPVWDPLLRAYYRERVFVDVDVSRVVWWPTLEAEGVPSITGPAMPESPEPQAPPKNGTEPRIDIDKAAAQLSSLPHRVLAYRGGDGFPVVVPVEFAGHDAGGIRLLTAPGVLPPGGRRAGLLAHSYRPHLVGLATRGFTGWLTVDGDDMVYTPHTTVGFFAPPNKNLLLVGNGLLAHAGVWRARRKGTADRLASIVPGGGRSG
jgi:hypothetical protein